MMAISHHIGMILAVLGIFLAYSAYSVRSDIGFLENKRIGYQGNDILVVITLRVHTQISLGRLQWCDVVVIHGVSANCQPINSVP